MSVLLLVLFRVLSLLPLQYCTAQAARVLRLFLFILTEGEGRKKKKDRRKEGKWQEGRQEGRGATDRPTEVPTAAGPPIKGREGGEEGRGLSLFLRRRRKVVIRFDDPPLPLRCMQGERGKEEREGETARPEWERRGRREGRRKDLHPWDRVSVERSELREGRTNGATCQASKEDRIE